MTLSPLVAGMHVIEKIEYVTLAVECVYLTANASVLSGWHVVDQITGAICKLDHACIVYAGIGELTNVAGFHNGGVSKIGSGEVGIDEGRTPFNWDFCIAQFVETFGAVEALSGEHCPAQVGSLERCVDHGGCFVESYSSQACRLECHAKEVGFAKVCLGYIALIEFYIHKFCSLERRSRTEDNTVYSGLDHCRITVVECCWKAARELILCALRYVHASKLEALPGQIDEFVAAVTDCLVTPVRCEHCACVTERFHALKRKALNCTPVDFPCFKGLPNLYAQSDCGRAGADPSEDESACLTHRVFVSLPRLPAAQCCCRLVSAARANRNSFHAPNSTNDCTQVQGAWAA